MHWVVRAVWRVRSIPVRYRPVLHGEIRQRYGSWEGRFSVSRALQFCRASCSSLSTAIVIEINHLDPLRMAVCLSPATGAAGSCTDVQALCIGRYRQAGFCIQCSSCGGTCSFRPHPGYRRPGSTPGQVLPAAPHKGPKFQHYNTKIIYFNSFILSRGVLIWAPQRRKGGSSHVVRLVCVQFLLNFIFIAFLDQRSLCGFLF